MVLLLAAKCSPSSNPSGAAALAGRAQEQKTDIPKPGPEHQRLGYFVGQWHLEGEIKPVIGPAGRDIEDDDCQWLGGFFVVCHSSETFWPERRMPSARVLGPARKTDKIGVFGYDATRKAYTYTDFSSLGEVGHLAVAVDGGTWTFTDSGEWEGKPVKSRYSIIEDGPDAYTYRWETSSKGAMWATILEGKATRVASGKPTRGPSH